MSRADKDGVSGTGGREDRFRLIIESMRDHAIFMLDPQGHVASWNPGAERIKGYTASEIIGQHFRVFYGEADQTRRHPEAELETARRHGSYTEEGWRIRKDGTRFWANVVITTVFDDDGNHVGFAKLTRDLSEQRQADELLRQSEERLRLLIESVRDYAIFMLDPEGKIATWNAGAQHIKGYRADEIIGQHFSIFSSPEEVAQGRPERALRVARAVGRYEEEGWRVRKNGERFWANVVLTAVYDETKQLRGFAKVTRDLNEQRRLAEEAHEAERQAALERERALEARGAVQRRDEFISVAAHELRTPLTALQLKLQSLRQVLRKVPADEAAVALPSFGDRLDGAMGQLRRLNELVERLLDVSRIVGGKLVMKPERVDLAVLVADVVDDLREPAAQAGSVLTRSAPAPVMGWWDRARIEQVLVNLLANAIKYGRGKPIETRVEAVPGGARLTITDYGIGIPPDALARIFNRFERAASQRHYGGLGLGLYIARNIVEAHGGTIRVTSSIGHGATFIINLPEVLV